MAIFFVSWAKVCKPDCRTRAVFDLSGQYVGVLDVVLRGAVICVRGGWSAQELYAAISAVRIEQPPEDGLAIRSREAEPVDGSTLADESGDPAVANQSERIHAPQYLKGSGQAPQFG